MTAFRVFYFMEIDMSKDPAFLFYTSDFLTGTMLFSNEQVGKYIRLLCLQHQKGHLQEKDMINICKSYDSDIFAKFIKDNDGLFYNERLEKEVIRRKEYSKSRYNNRVGHMSNISLSYVQHMETENETDTEDINTNELFEKFWSAYPKRNGKKLGKAETLKKFKAIKEIDNLMIAVKNYAESKVARDGYAKDAKRFLQNDYWKDWIDGSGETGDKQKDRVAKDLETMKRMSGI